MFALVQRGMLLAKLTYPGGVRFEIEKFHWLGSLNSETAVTLAWNETAPHRTAKDLFEKELIVGGIVGVDPETTPRLYNSLIGTKFKVVNGYNSTAADRARDGARRGPGHRRTFRGRASRRCGRTGSARRRSRCCCRARLNRDPELGDLPSALDFVKNDADRKVMELHFTQKLAARPIIAPPGVPADRVAILRAAFEALGKDKDFLADAEKSKQEVNFVSGEEVEKVVALIVATPADIAERYAKAFAPEAK